MAANSFDGVDIFTENPDFDLKEIQGFSESEISDLEGSLGFPLSPQLRDWVARYGHSMVGPGGIADMDPEDGMGILDRTQMHPEWAEQGWVPLGGEWCGNYYVVATHGEPNLPEPVYFVDASEDQDLPTYIAASSPSTFVGSLMSREKGTIDWHWPFDQAKTLALDPDIAKSSAPMPWNA